nr:DUF6236 family protein [Sphingomonas jinjuensis]
MGVVLSSPCEIISWADPSNPGQVQPVQTHGKTRPSRLELYQSLLIWDKIHLPEAPNDFYERDPEIQLLIGEGIARRFESPLTKSMMVSPIMELEHFHQVYYNQDDTERLTVARATLFDALQRSEPNRWTLAAGLQSPRLSNDHLIDGNGTVIELAKILPMPEGTVPLDDILRFREDRRDELRELRINLIRLYDRITEGSDFLKAAEMQDFLSKVEAYKRVLGERGFKAVLTSLRANISSALQSAGEQAVSGWATGSEKHQIVAGAVTSFVTSMVGAAFRGQSATPVPFQVLTEFHRELPWMPE